MTAVAETEAGEGMDAAGGWREVPFLDETSG
jgi:hypothetical protein